MLIALNSSLLVTYREISLSTSSNLVCWNQESARDRVSGCCSFLPAEKCRCWTCKHQYDLHHSTETVFSCLNVPFYVILFHMHLQPTESLTCIDHSDSTMSSTSKYYLKGVSVCVRECINSAKYVHLMDWWWKRQVNANWILLVRGVLRSPLSFQLLCLIV